MIQHQKTSHFYALLAGVVLQILPAFTVHAQTLEVEMSAKTVRVGQPVELRIKSKGGSQARVLEKPEVEGLALTGNQQQFQMQMALPKFGMQVTTVQTYVFVPTRTGEFTIPALKVRLDGKVLQTPPQKLQVVPGGGGSMPVLPAIPIPQQGTGQGLGQGLGQGSGQGIVPPPPDPQDPNDAPDPSTDREAKDYFGELVVPKKTAYVGEFVPVDLRFNVDANYPAQFSERPVFSGEGFTVSQTAKPTQVARDVDGTEYACVIYRTAITPAKAGTLEIPPAAVAARVQVPVQMPHSNSMFGNMLQNFGMSDVREIEIQTEGASLDVKPLPREGKPSDFAGAVGEFKIQTTASPAKAGPGEPITLKVDVSGRGNFEAMGPPTLEENDGWKVYDPSEDFQPSPTDPIGFNGTKTYSFTLVARKDQNATPAVSFSFFDPAKEKYVTLEGAPVAVTAAGSSQQSANAVAAVTPANAPGSPSPSPAIAKTSGDLKRNFAPGSFEPVAWSKGFVVAGIVFGTLWTLALVVLSIRRYSASASAARSRKLRSLRASLNALDDSSVQDSEFLTKAHDLLVIALQDRDEAQLPDELTQNISLLRSKFEEARYSTRSLAALGSESRKSILQTLKALLDSYV